MTHTSSSTKNSIKVLIVGAGAIGAFYGGKLAQAGAHVAAVCRSDYDTVREQGFSVKSPLGDFQFVPQPTLHSINEYKDTPDLILVALKVLPDLDVAGLLQPVVGPQTAILMIQNGVSIEDSVAETFPNNEVLGGLAFVCLSRIGPGKIHHIDYGRLVIGKYPEGPSDMANRLRELWNSVDVKTQITPSVVRARWKKLVWNAPFNPMSVLCGHATTQDLMESEETVKLVRHVMEEVVQVAKAAGHELPPNTVQENIDDTLKMTPYRTSMLLDYEARRPMEVEAILGTPVHLARRLNVRVPHLESLYAMLQLLNQQNLKT